MEYQKTVADEEVKIADMSSDPNVVTYDGVIERVLFENCRVVGPPSSPR